MDMRIESLASKVRQATPAVTAIILVTIATGCSAGCSASVSVGHEKTGGTYRGHGVSFKIPDGWRRLTDLTTQASAGNEKWSEGFAPRSGSDLVGITAYATKLAITDGNAGRYAPDVTAAIKNLLAPTGGSVVSGPTLISISGMAGYRFETAFNGK
ncbi:MAG: hypothetical protein IMZ71_02190, partial [Chloroflexi bacterium]|nr:hypothetical protein [Chloroflexota bacterium]